MHTRETVVSWQHDVDLRNVADKRNEIDRALEGHDVDTLVIDLRELDFVDSLGLGVLIHARDKCEDASADLVLRHVPERTKKLLATAGLDSLFTVE